MQRESISLILEIPMASSASNPSIDSVSHRMWTEIDDELPDFMAEMLTSAIIGELLETTISSWGNGGGSHIGPARSKRVAPPPHRAAKVLYLIPRSNKASTVRS
jgi:hypothetical protein